MHGNSFFRLNISQVRTIMMPVTRSASLASIAVFLLLLLSEAVVADAPPVYATPDAAVKSLIEAARSEQPDAVVEVLGPGATELRSVDPVADAADRRDFVEAATEAARLDLLSNDIAILSVGTESWPFPIPIVRGEEGWLFDLDAGKEELINRRIGKNELYAIEVARAYVDAQYEYAASDHNGDGRREYAQKILSDPGQRNGLYWPTEAGEPESPFGPLVAAAVAEGYGPGEGESEEGPRPYHGYLYHVLLSQGDGTQNAEDSWMVDGRLVRGFGLIAYPADYGNSGIMTFLVNDSGLVWERDLGEDTAQVAAGITSFDPDEDWQVVTD